jgi:hypothetical protein
MKDCQAKLKLINIGKTKEYFIKNSHSHLPSQTPRVPQEIRTEIKDQINVGAKPGRIHMNLLNNPKNDKNRLPTKKQIENYEQYDKRKRIPTVFQNLKLRFGQNFVRKIDVHPTYRVVAYTYFGMEQLIQCKKFLIVELYNYF